MGLTPRTRNEVQFLKLLEKTRALEKNSWRKTHYYEHLKKLYDILRETPGLSADDRVNHEKAMADLSKEMDLISNESRPSQITELIHRRRAIVEEQQRLNTPEKPKPFSPMKSPNRQSQEEYVPEPDVSEVLKQHKERQSKLADQMLAMTHNLKQVSVAARDIIQQDNKNLSELDDLVNKNTATLTRETAQLEQFNQSSSKCWVWSLIFVVIVIFIIMVIFIRLFPQRR